MVHRRRARFGPPWTTRSRDDARGLLASGRTAALTYGPDGERRGEGLTVFVSSFAPAPRMLVFGAMDFTAAVARVASFLGYRVTVCDARPVFATARRIPDGRRGDRRLAPPLPARRGRRRRASRAHVICVGPTTRSSTCRCSSKR